MTAPVFDPVLNSRPRRLADLLKAGMGDQPQPVSNGLGAPTDYKLADIANAGVDHSPQLREVSPDRHQRLLDVLRGVAGGLADISDNNTGTGGFLRDLGRGYASTSDTMQGLQEHREDRGLEEENRAAVQAERIRQALRQQDQDQFAHDRFDYERNHDAAVLKGQAARDKTPTPRAPAQKPWEAAGFDGPTGEADYLAFQRRAHPEQFDGGRGGGPPRDERPDYVRRRIAQLTSDKTDPYDGTVIREGMSIQDATKLANQEFDASEGNVPEAPPPPPDHSLRGSIRRAEQIAIGQRPPPAPPGYDPKAWASDLQRAATDTAFAAHLRSKKLIP